MEKEQEKQILQAIKGFTMRAQLQGNEAQTFNIVQQYLDKKIMDCEQSMSVSEDKEQEE